MRYNVVNNLTGQVVNTIEWDGESDFEITGHHFELAVQLDSNPARVPTPDQENNAQVFAELSMIDQKKIRAMSDYILTGDATKLNALEAHAEMLRGQIRKV